MSVLPFPWKHEDGHLRLTIDPDNVIDTGLDVTTFVSHYPDVIARCVDAASELMVVLLRPSGDLDVIILITTEFLGILSQQEMVAGWTLHRHGSYAYYHGPSIITDIRTLTQEDLVYGVTIRMLDVSGHILNMSVRQQPLRLVIDPIESQEEYDNIRGPLVVTDKRLGVISRDQVLTSKYEVEDVDMCGLGIVRINDKLVELRILEGRIRERSVVIEGVNARDVLKVGDRKWLSKAGQLYVAGLVLTNSSETIIRSSVRVVDDILYYCKHGAVFLILKNDGCIYNCGSSFKTITKVAENAVAIQGYRPPELPTWVRKRADQRAN